MYGPDFSSSDDELLQDDPEYYIYKEKAKKLNVYQQTQNENISSEQKLINTCFYSITNGILPEVVSAFDNGLDINVDLDRGWTPLLLACSVGKVEVVKELIKRGADINKSKDRQTTLMLACDCPKETSPFEDILEIVKELVNNKCNVNICDRKRKTAIMYAAFNGNLEVVKFLLPLCDRNAEDNQKWTVLFWAVSGDSVETVKYLLEEGLPYNILDIRQQSPKDVAKENEFEEILNMFSVDDEEDVIYAIFDAHKYSYETIFNDLKFSEKPEYFLDICSILYGTKSHRLIKLFSDKSIDLQTFLSSTDEELQNNGILLPFQRNRILTGLYRFHKYPFSPKSLHVVQRNEVYCNIDAFIAIVCAIKQFIAMQASFNFMKKHYLKNNTPLSDKDQLEIQTHIITVRRKIKTLQRLSNKIYDQVNKWDELVKPVDMIKPTTRKRRMPWRTITFSLTIISIILIIKIK